MGNSMFLYAAGDIHWSIVCLIGVAVVFIGLACIIGLVELMTFICNKLLDGGSKKQPAKSEAAPAATVSAPSAQIENRGEILAAVCAAVAEEEGTDISAIRVVSFKKIS